MTEIQLLNQIKEMCKKAKSNMILLSGFMPYMVVIEELMLRGCIEVEYMRDKAKIKFVKDMPDNPVGIIDLTSEKSQKILKHLREKVPQKQIAKIEHVSRSEIKKYNDYLKMCLLNNEKSGIIN